MAWTWLPLPLMYLTLALLLRVEERRPRDERQVYLWKPLTTLLVIFAAASSFARPAGQYDVRYTALILAGLAFSMAGDVLLIPVDKPQAFLAGLVAFLLGHVMYIAAFVYLQASVIRAVSWPGELVSALGLIVTGTVVYRYLRPGLGQMRVPVIAYIAVISIMVDRAFGITWVHTGPATQPALTLVGALLFYLSDAILAINRFRLEGKMPHYRLWNLSTYYTGQLLIALSTWFN
jgi:uncharacterized membrane protein YhhN